MRADLLFFAAAFGLTVASTSASPLASFEFVQASDLNPIVNLGNGQTLQGTFSVDLGRLPVGLYATAPLSSVDVVIDFSNNYIDYTRGSIEDVDDFEFTPAFGGSPFFATLYQVDVLDGIAPHWIFNFVEEQGTFVGGQVWGLGAPESVIAVDPEILTPEPSTLIVIGAVLLGLSRQKRRTGYVRPRLAV